MSHPLQNAASLDDVKQVFATASDHNALIPPDTSDDASASQMIIADGHRSANRKTQLCVACEGPGGFLGTIIVHPSLEPRQYAAMPIDSREWQVTRFQAHWFEWRHGNPVHQHSRVRDAGPGRFWLKIRLIWEAGLPAEDDFDVVCDPHIPGDLAPLPN